MRRSSADWANSPPGFSRGDATVHIVITPEFIRGDVRRSISPLYAFQMMIPVKYEGRHPQVTRMKR
ncbi:hypothetical protein J7M28_06890, partial [bacterium]|nr:hypothetical protein [bacterium]